MTIRQKDDAGDETAFGYRTVALGEKQTMVDDVFHKVARRYDIMNDAMSGGLHRLWKDAFIAKLAPPRSGSRPYEVLDVAGGTGDITFRILGKAHDRAKVTICDINHAMLTVGRERAERRGVADRIEFVQGNAEDLPIASDRFNAYTIAFGIRNVPRIQEAVNEAFRVLKPGGRFLCLEFSQMDLPLADKLYDLYSFNVIPAIGKMIAGDAEPYRYLVESIRVFPHKARFAKMIQDAGFSRVDVTPLAGGAVAIHSGWKL
ncbi:demethylmenaquinone methyltransferase/2-methoxy-6-polyprenyl-1,4-benzoquinol methylase [Rhodobium orientis]|uniref:Ubiquinone/menaquinone biosynthesis C-methyltransferase UbiE n=1 Tax=Rhodobium orientis TaxID=34017 RepID=A0A327JGY8_9HYPH|nr:bifunctional demethylmenaquinone methyltransferase/2-methoxy-6-polyprenyl-1,4-benzoquinol methylase UbiE [Rhodobium orientis]MBB4304486.1 demethylmenaquinone methyltransferase/2-methoxy-6-polyprenyl-1,4-benzoquinol methylase [Rhodobium orientis]MBK5948077.1 bifunctional demethylmenaquinone methyltransferase/2-methoxy-6-polyprenyl-1,4-benzoquinol methylase [Rhodobium orientis]RAI25375.1 bifunctional demethylmenaquinone methyltransferase/2-methoxy-6-polyprenyl-1,4-benzoquinol methylase [Rhodobi